MSAVENELAQRYSQRLRMFATRRLGDPSAAEDVAQETLRRVVQALREDRIANRDALPGFVFTTARNICLHWVRSSARESNALERFHRGAEVASGADALSSLISEERRNTVRTALENLDTSDRALLSMIYYDGLDGDEAASRLGVTPSTLRVRKHRALRRLADVLSADETRNERNASGTLNK